MTAASGLAPTPHPVLVVGDANVDLVLRGDVVPRFGQAEQLLDGAELVLGSSASIVACGLARLGVPTSLAAVVGNDDFGRFTREALRAAGVDATAVRTDSTAPTGVSVILSALSDRAILTLPGTIPLLTTADVLSALGTSGARWVHFASPFLMPRFAAELPELLRELRARGIRTSVDTNWDPAGAWAGVAEWVALVDILMPNRAELEAICAVLDPADESTSPGAAVTARGATVVVKDGGDGGWSLETDDALCRAPGLRIEVVDTTGAGDSFDAGYLAAIAYGVEPAQRRLRWATVAGSLSTRAVGGTAAQADLELLLSHLDDDATT